MLLIHYILNWIVIYIFIIAKVGEKQTEKSTQLHLIQRS